MCALQVYTTSESILGSKRFPLFRPSGPIYQLLGERGCGGGGRPGLCSGDVVHYVPSQFVQVLVWHLV